MYLAHIKTILVKIIVSLIALQVINLSIDFDYLAGNTCKRPGFDDTDSITEYLIEKIAGNNYIIDNDDDEDGSAQEKGSEKTGNDDQWYFEHTDTNLCFVIGNNTHDTGMLRLANKPCRGHFYIEAPPPDSIHC